MYRILLLASLLILQASNSQAQQVKLFPFKIEGYINADTGTVRLTPVADKEYYSTTTTPLEGKVKDKKFLIEGHLPYPLSYNLSYKKFRTGRFIVQKGPQLITINLDSNDRVPQVDNLIMKEDYRMFNDHYKNFNRKRASLDKRWDSLMVKFHKDIPKDIKAVEEQAINDSYKESDRLLLSYVSSHPDSYYAFWNLLFLMNFGYENIFDSIYAKFSDSIKATQAAKLLAQNLKISGKLGIGKQFPTVPSINAKNQKFSTEIVLKNKYTLIDFWYSNCGPCRAQTPDFKAMYKTYHSRGFEIVGISTDKLEHKKDWLDVIRKDELIWPQFWDVNGKETANLSINAFPTNFLLDSFGKIIKKNMRTAELEQFLRENIK